MNRFHALAAGCQQDAARYSKEAINARLDAIMYKERGDMRAFNNAARDANFYSARARHWHRFANSNREAGDYEIFIEAGRNAAHGA